MSSETKFTPGEWMLDPHGNTVEVCGMRCATVEVFSRKDACWIAQVLDHRNCAQTQSGQWNAHLIAAAPDLYEALESAAVHLEEMRKDKKHHPIGHCPVLDMVRAALSRARGEDPAGGAE